MRRGWLVNRGTRRICRLKKMEKRKLRKVAATSQSVSTTRRWPAKFANKSTQQPYPLLASRNLASASTYFPCITNKFPMLETYTEFLYEACHMLFPGDEEKTIMCVALNLFRFNSISFRFRSKILSPATTKSSQKFQTLLCFSHPAAVAPFA